MSMLDAIYKLPEIQMLVHADAKSAAVTKAENRTKTNMNERSTALLKRSALRCSIDLS